MRTILFGVLMLAAASGWAGDGIHGTDGAGKEREFVGKRVGVAVRRAENRKQHPLANAVPGNSGVRLLTVGGPRKSEGLRRPAR